MNSIKPIETVYKGYRFRSRLEARWAVFFDTCEIEYLYEPQGFKLGNGLYYLPDFYLPNVKDGMWVEIKGVMDKESEKKIEAFREGLPDAQGLIVLGDIPTVTDYCDYISLMENDWSIGYDNCHVWCRCPVCGKFGYEYEGRENRVCNHKLEIETVTDGAFDEDYVFYISHMKLDGKEVLVDDYIFNGLGRTGRVWSIERAGYSKKESQALIIRAFIAARQARFEHGEKPE